MITITQANLSDIGQIQEIVYKTWPHAYGDILSKAQIDYMLDLFYSSAVLHSDILERNNYFLLLNEGSICMGFAACGHHYLNKNLLRLHKIYLLPEAQGKGLGKLLMEAVENLAIKNHLSVISLNVNRFNPAILFYQKLGFIIVSEEDLEIGHGYLMEDYKMEKQL